MTGHATSSLYRLVTDGEREVSPDVKKALRQALAQHGMAMVNLNRVRDPQLRARIRAEAERQFAG